jgi:hypothetical protein
MGRSKDELAFFSLNNEFRDKIYKTIDDYMWNNFAKEYIERYGDIMDIEEFV